MSLSGMMVTGLALVLLVVADALAEDALHHHDQEEAGIARLLFDVTSHIITLDNGLSSAVMGLVILITVTGLAVYGALALGRESTGLLTQPLSLVTPSLEEASSAIQQLLEEATKRLQKRGSSDKAAATRL
ncbi:uncharacterized protein [Panulirus ornatus]|uniref:uncharacterized protein n=1 Tax=Panulirus ornatus TaxID=150431 RepID=UPI003A87D344